MPYPTGDAQQPAAANSFRVENVTVGREATDIPSELIHAREFAWLVRQGSWRKGMPNLRRTLCYGVLASYGWGAISAVRVVSSRDNARVSQEKDS